MARRKGNIAFFILNLENLQGGNGAERFFADLYQIYRSKPDQKFNLFFITDSIENYRAIGKFRGQDKNLILLNFTGKWHRNTHSKVPPLFRKVLRFFILIAAYTELTYKIIRNGINVVHLCLYIKFDYPFVKLIDALPGFVRPKIVLNMVDCTVPYYYFRDEPEYIRTSAHRFHHEKLFNTVHIDAVYSWYENVRTFLHEHSLIKSNPPIECITSRFVLNHAPVKDVPKKNIILFAGRLNSQKNPLMFLEAIHILVKRNVAGLQEWMFKIYGRGTQEQEVADKIKYYGLQDVVELTFHKNMAEVFSETKCFVSPQDFENFPSMAMAEAMINRNAVIARNVGQTHLFVKHGVNGILIDPDNETGLANALEDYIINNDKYIHYGEESLKLMQTVHTPENFIRQINGFWSSVLSN